MTNIRLSSRALALASAALLLNAGSVATATEAIEKSAADKSVQAEGTDGPVATTSKSTSGKAKVQALGSFTPPTLDGVRRTTASGAGAVEERTFRFTPSGKAGDRKALSVGVTSRVVRTAALESAKPAASAASGYNVDFAVAYLGFALSGGFSRLDTIFESSREGVDLGLSYRGNRWKTALQLNADRPRSNSLSPLGADRRLSVELGGAYALSSRLSVLGGVRYQTSEPDLAGGNILSLTGDPLSAETEAGSIYLGTSLSF